MHSDDKCVALQCPLSWPLLSMLKGMAGGRLKQATDQYQSSYQESGYQHAPLSLFATYIDACKSVLESANTK